MKVAIQFFGHIRTFDECFESVKKHLIDIYDCDVFMHTWDKTDHESKTWHKAKRIIKSVDSQTIQQLKKDYNLKELIVESQELDNNREIVSCQHNYGETQISINGLRYMLYSQAKVNNLRKNYQNKHNIKYDFIVFIRPDVKLNSDFILDELNHAINMQGNNPARYCACNLTSKEFPIIGSCASDVIFVGKPKDIDKSIETLNHIEFTKNKNKIWSPECLFNQQLKQAGISSIFINYIYGRDWEIIRPQENTKIKKITIRKKIIRLKISKREFNLHLFSFISRPILAVQFSILNMFYVNLLVGSKQNG